MTVGMAAKGHTHVIMVLNMRRFVVDDDRERFEALRGSPDFVNILRHNAAAWSQQTVFTPLREYMQNWEADTPSSQRMSAEEVGFATGVFRGLMMERLNTPSYRLEKSQVRFEPGLRTNFQFKTLFQRAWDQWQIVLRPNFAGFFTIRLTHTYLKEPRPFLHLVQDILRLQESLDIPSAQEQLVKNREKYADDPETLQEKEQSINQFLHWLGADQGESSQVLYYPVQWKMAMEICSRFVQAIGSKLEIPNQEDIRLQVPKPSLSIPLHDCYVVHHFNELLADPGEIVRIKTPANRNAMASVKMNDIRKSPRLRRNLMSLMEGSVLHRQSPDPKMQEEFCFPVPRWSISDSIDKINQASWNDELCLMAGRTAIVYPSNQWSDFEIAVSTVPSSTLRAQYTHYWDAVERMIELVMEVRVLAQLVESLSYDLLVKITSAVHATRFKLFSGDIQLDHNMPDLIKDAASLRRLSSLVQSLNHPMLWARAEYATQKAEHLLGQLGVTQTLEHIQRNIEGINSVVDHVDELYLADLAEKNNEKATILSVSLAAASLTLTLLMLPSFWADISNLLQAQSIPPGLANFLIIFGTLVAFALILMASIVLSIAFRKIGELKSIFRRFINGKG